jgi:hypothetical protein
MPGGTERIFEETTSLEESQFADLLLPLAKALEGWREQAGVAEFSRIPDEPTGAACAAVEPIAPSESMAQPSSEEQKSF